MIFFILLLREIFDFVNKNAFKLNFLVMLEIDLNFIVVFYFLKITAQTLLILTKLYFK